jgi:hypothetical protein
MPLLKPIHLYNFDGTLCGNEPITHQVQITLSVPNRPTFPNTEFLVTQLSLPYLIVLGLPWIQQTGLVIDWPTLSIMFPTCMPKIELTDAATFANDSDGTETCEQSVG